MPTFENEGSPEEKLVRLLKEKGAEDPEARKFLNDWTEEQERRVEQSKDYDAKIKFNLTRGRLYFKAGYVDEAFENFEDARIQAWNEQRIELYQAIMREGDEMEKSLKK